MNMQEAIRRINLVETNGLTDLDLSDCGLKEIPIELEKTGHLIHSLDVAGNFIGPKGAAQIATYCPNLVSLKLGRYNGRPNGRNLIFAEGAKAIASLSSLNYLDITDNLIGPQGAKVVGTMKALKGLKIGDNSIGDDGARALAQLSKLEDLSVRSNHLGYEGAKALSQLSVLTNLDISFNRIGADGATAISCLSNLISLNITYGYIEYEGAQSLVAIPGLEKLDMSNNDIKDRGAQAISAAKSLIELNISSNYIGNEGALAIASMKGLTNLNIGYNKEIEKEGIEDLSLLTNLEHLYIPGVDDGRKGVQAIANLTRLKSLDISFMGTGPDGMEIISSLSALTKLRAHQNWIKADGLKSICKLANLKELDIGLNAIKSNVKNILASLPALTFLDISSNNIGEDGAKGIAAVKSLTRLNINFNKIGVEGAKAIATLSNLSHLDIIGNNIKADGLKAISSLESLRYLDIRDNSLGSDAGAYWSGLQELQFLNAGENMLGPNGVDGLPSLTKLQTLKIESNRVGDTGAATIGLITSLEHLDLNRNVIGLKGATAIAGLTNLTELCLMENMIDDDGAKTFGSLTYLRRLFLGSNIIGDDGAEVIATIKGLCNLQIWKNGLTDRGAAAIATMPFITGLGVGNNYIADEGLRALALSPIAQSDFYIGIDGNRPVNIPKEITDDIRKLRAYVIALNYGKERGRSARIILCGNTLVGKTSLATKLSDRRTENPEPDDRTHGIRHWQPADMIKRTGIFVNIWDFGGQDYYHATHAAALNTGNKKEDNAHTVYLLVWRKEEEDQDFYNEGQKMALDYWLGFILNIAGKEAAIEMVQTFSDKTAMGKYPFGAKMLQEDIFNLSNNKHFISLNTTQLNTSNSIALKQWEHFESSLFSLIEEKAKSAEYPKIWEEIRRTHLPQISGKINIDNNSSTERKNIRAAISKAALKNEMLKTAAFANISNDEKENALQFEGLLDYLRRCGEVLFWKPSETDDPLLLDTVVIDLQAFHQIIYEELLTLKVLENGGRFVPHPNHALYMAYLQANGLIFKERECQNSFVAPQYLPLPPRKRIISKLLKIKIYLLHPFYLPKYLISRFIVLMNDIGKNVDYWKYDCECEIDGIDVVVSLDMEKQQITIHCSEGVQQKELLRKLLYYFGSFGAFNPWARAVERSAFPVDEFKAVKTVLPSSGEIIDQYWQLSEDGQTYYEIKELEKVKNGIARTTVGDNQVVPELMATLLNHPNNKMHNIFISYSKNDLEIVRELELAFANLQRQKKVRVWTDGQIEPGKAWDAAIKQKLDDADTVLCFISPGLIANDYVMNVELPRVSMRLGDEHIIPIFATSSDIEGIDLDRWQGLLTIKQYPAPVEERHCQNGIYWLRNIPKDHRDIYYTAIVKALRKRYGW